MTSTVSVSSRCGFFFFFLNSMRIGLYSSKAVGVIRKNTELLQIV